MYYLDNAATTRPYDDIIDFVREWLSEYYANPSSSHALGQKSRRLIETSRGQIAEIFDVPEAGVIFCGSGTESDNLAIKGTIDKLARKAGNIITTRLEHVAVKNAVLWVQQKGVEVRYVDIDPNTGQVDLNHLEQLVDESTRLVSIQHVNSETGIIQDLAAIGKIIKQKNEITLFHSDGVQAFSKIPVNLSDTRLDLYSISGHKFHAIKGAAALILTKNVPMSPLIHGGGQEHGLRSGTENIAAIAAMSFAARKSVSDMAQSTQSISDFTQRFRLNVRASNPKIQIYDNPRTVPHILNLAVKGIPGEVLQNHLAEAGIYVSTGSACSEKTRQLSPTLQALGFSSERIKQSIRLSLAAREIPVDYEDFGEKFLNVVDQLLSLV